MSLVYCYNRKKKLVYIKEPVYTVDLKNQDKENQYELIIDNQLFTFVDLKPNIDFSCFYFIGRKDVFYEHNTCFELY